MLTVLERQEEQTEDEPPNFPPVCGDNDDDRPDKCDRCPVRQMLVDKEQAIKDAAQMAEWARIALSVLGIELKITETDMKRIYTLRMMAFMPCGGLVESERLPGRLRRKRILLLAVKVLFCGNENVPAHVRQKHPYFLYKGEDGENDD